MFDAAPAANDVVHCVDSGEYENITASIPFSIACPQVDAAMQLISYRFPSPGVAVIDGVNFDCRPFATQDGITFTGSGTLIIRNVTIRNCTNGISFRPNGAATLSISNVKINYNTSVGVLIQPTGSASAKVEIDGLQATNNVGGLLAQAAAGTTVDVEMRNSVLAQNSNYGVVSLGTGGVSAVFVEASSFSENANIGVYSNGANSFVLVNRSTIVRNNIGWAFAAGGVLGTYANNVANNASACCGPSVTVGLQ